MAFKLLNMEEMDLLNDQQKAQYEEDLALYRQRSAFVEQLEALENVRIDPYEAKLESIDMMNEREVKIYKNPEYILTICEPPAKPEPQFISFEIPEGVKAELPFVGEKPDISFNTIIKPKASEPELPVIDVPAANLRSLEKIEVINPNLPQILKPETVDRTYKRPKRTQGKLPSIKKPSIKAELPIGELQNKRELPNQIPEINMPKMGLPHFAVSSNDSVILPEVSVSCARTQAFRKPEPSQAELPVIVKPNMNINSYQEVKITQVDLPKASEISTEIKAAFRKPEHSLVELQSISRPEMRNPEFKKEKLAKPKLPKVTAPKPETGKFRITKRNSPDLPSVHKLGGEVKAFQKPEQHQLNLPAAVPIYMADKTFEQVKTVRPIVDKIEMPHILVKSFTKSERTTPRLPEGKNTQIPDADKVREELLSVIKEEYNTLIG